MARRNYAHTLDVADLPHTSVAEVEAGVVAGELRLVAPRRAVRSCLMSGRGEAGLADGRDKGRCGQLTRRRLSGSGGWEASGTMAADAELIRGREAGERLAWGDAYGSLSLADKSNCLAGEDLEDRKSVV